MNTAPATLETLAADHRFDRQIALVRKHWTSVRHLWIQDPGFQGPDVPTARKLRSNLPGEFWLGCGLPGLAKIRPICDGRFDFTEEGKAAAIIPAYDTVPGLVGTNAELNLEHLTDLVAVDLDRPDNFWRHRGDALVLGAAYLEIAGQEGEPVSVYRNPMTWLRSGGDGIAVLDWGWVPDLLLGFELIAEDVETGNRLEAALRPAVWVREAA